MELPTEIFGDVIVVHTPEELSESHSEQLEDYLTSLERSNVIVDLDGTESLDSAGLTTLVNAQEILRHLALPLAGAHEKRLNQALRRDMNLAQGRAQALGTAETSKAGSRRVSSVVASAEKWTRRPS